MSLNRRQFMLGLGALGAVGVAGCSASSGGSGGGSGTTTLTVMYQSNEFSEEEVAAFEQANTDLKITFLEYDETRLNAMLAAGGPPDFVRGTPSPNSFARGLAHPIDEYLASSKVIRSGDLLPINDNWRWDGKTVGAGPRYGLVKDWSGDAAIWQNTDLLEKAKVEPLSTSEPTGWDELLEKARELKAAKVKYPLGVEWAWGLGSKIILMMHQQGAPIYSDDLTTAQFTGPDAVRAVQWFVDLAKEGLGPSSLNPLPDGSDFGVFAAGDMALTMDGYWFGGNFQKGDSSKIRKNLAMAPAPTFGERANISFNGGLGAWIPAKAEHKDEAWRLMEYFMAGQPALDRARSGWGLPALQSLWSELPTEFPYQEQALATAQEDLKYLPTLPTSPYLSSNAWNQALDAEVTSVLKGDQSVAEACAKVQEQINTALAQGKDQIG